MRLYVIHDAQGNIIAATEAKTDPNSVQVKLKAGPGQTIAELDVPAQHESLGLLELSQQLRVNTQSGKLIAKQ